MSESDQSGAESANGLRRLPAPHNRVEFRIGAEATPGFASAKCTIEYYGIGEDLISAGVVTPEMIAYKSGSEIPTRGMRVRRDAAGGRVFVRYLKNHLAVHFLEALERGLALPGVTSDLRDATKTKAMADYQRRFREVCDPPDEGQETPIDETYLKAAAVPLKNLIAIVEQSPALTKKIGVYLGRIDEALRTESERLAEFGARKSRRGFLRLVVNNAVSPMSTASTNLDRSAGLFEDIKPEAWARGSALAIKMLEECCDDLNKVCMHNEARDGAPQDNVLYRYLQRVRKEGANGPQVEQAFCSVITDYIGSAPQGAWDIDAIEKQARESGPVRQAVWQ